MGKRLSLAGKKFGRLTVVECLGIDKFCRTIWRCTCECGKQKVIPGSNLIRGTKSCGCITKEVPTWTTELYGSGATKPNGVSAFNDLYSSYKYRAKKKNMEFRLSKEKFRELTSKNCFYCGDDPQKLHGRNDLNGGYVFNGIDRIDNKLGYIDGNVITCCSICNKMKLDTDYNIFLFRVKKIYLKLMHGGWE
jgi:hypothetical protein